jgi:hypothetical protein
MLRRWATLLIASFAVLGLASPALACAALLSAARDCCPEGGPAPCKGQPSSEVACCLVAPTPAPAASVNANTERLIPQPAGSTPDPVILATWLHTLAPVPAFSLRIEPRASFRGSADATLTYLHTGRLRL